MEKDIMVTIGIPVYNAEPYLRPAIDSVLGQSYTNFELIISIDGCADSSADIVRSYMDSRIRVICENENRGIAYRINQQVSMARGKYFARMDADDIMFPERIETQLRFLTQNPDVDVAGCQAVVINEQNEIIGFRDVNTDYSKYSVLKKALFIHPTVFGKISWFRENAYSSEYDGVEDYFLWNTALSGAVFCNQTKTLLFYRDPPESSINKYLFRQRQVRKVLFKLFERKIISGCNYIEMSVLALLKSILYQVAMNLGFSNILVSRRNKTLTGEKLIFYNTVLRSIIKNR